MFEDKKEKPRFELVILLKDSEGIPTGKRKSFTAEDGPTLARHWSTNNGLVKKKKKKIKAAKTEKEITEGLEEMVSYVEKIRKNKRLED